MSPTTYQHKMAAHCETGTVAGILSHNGLAISEPMVLGIAGGIFFAYLESRRFPFPMFVTRTKPGNIRTKISKRLGAKFQTFQYKRHPERSATDLDGLLDQGIPVAAQVDMFYMDYIPNHMKVHFNGHFIVIAGKEGDFYTVSDCYYPTLAALAASSLHKSRFALGDMAPHGFMFFPTEVPKDVDLRTCIVRGIKDACWNMIKIPVPFVGVKGIRTFARKLQEWPKLVRDTDHLSHEVMMINVTLEEKGTGGAGFRFMFATFLQEASSVLGRPEFNAMAKKMMDIGDRWRDISLFSARIGKNRDLGPARLRELGDMILARADEEEAFFRELLPMARG